MLKQLILTVCVVLTLVTSFGCSSRGFMVIEDAPYGALPHQTLGMRYGVDSGSLSPTERYSWLELCDKVMKPSFIFFTSEDYKNCIPQMPLTAQANKTTATGWVAGIVAPVVSSGMQAGAIAFAGYQIGQGIGKTGTKVTTNNNNGGNSTAATGGNSSGQTQGQNQAQLQHQSATGGTSSVTGSGNSTNTNNAAGGVGTGGQGGTTGGCYKPHAGSPFYELGPC